MKRHSLDVSDCPFHSLFKCSPFVKGRNCPVFKASARCQDHPAWPDCSLDYWVEVQAL